MINPFLKVTTFLTVCLSLIIPALAQEEDEESSPKIEEVTVTAQRVEENIQDVPLSVSAFGSAALEEAANHYTVRHSNQHSKCILHGCKFWWIQF